MPRHEPDAGGRDRRRGLGAHLLLVRNPAQRVALSTAGMHLVCAAAALLPKILSTSGPCTSPQPRSPVTPFRPVFWLVSLRFCVCLTMF